MKRLLLLSFLCLFLFSQKSSAQTGPITSASRYTVAVNEDSHGAIKVEVSSIFPKGVYLVGDSVRVTEENGLTVKHLRARFTVDPEREKARPSDAYRVLFTKHSLDRVVLSVFTDNIQDINEQVIWTKPQ